jgi:hypothetical protein
VLCIVALLCAGAKSHAQEDKKLPLSQAAEQAVQQSRLTLAGSAPFHLKARIADAVNSNPAYNAEVEEDWISPAKWRRTIKSADFSQTLTVDGDKISETNTGDYYPFWLRDLVTAVFDPLPMLEQLKHFNSILTLPMDDPQSRACVQMNVPSGTTELKTTLSYAFCFQGRTGLLQEVVTPGFRAGFQEYKPFNQKKVPRRVIFTPGPGIGIEARIIELAPLKDVNESLFAVTTSTPISEQLKNIQLGESMARALQIKTPEIEWPSVREGATSGVMSLYISADRSGHVREVWPFQSDNPELLAAARKQVQQWQFKPYVNPKPMQMESVLTFAFAAKQGPPIPVLGNAEARKLATHIVEPRLKPGTSPAGTKFTVRVLVDEEGKLVDVRNPKQTRPALFQAADRALHQWQFRPYIKDGTPDRFYADIIFAVR